MTNIYAEVNSGLLLSKTDGIFYDGAPNRPFALEKHRMTWTQIAQNYWVSPQISASQLDEAKALGFDTVVCNRPDDEEPGQINSDVIAAACATLGLDYLFLPMQGANFSAEYVEQIQQLNQANKKVLAYCRSGNRSSILYNAAAV
ncbi:MAG: hypothetical protein ACI9RY_000895 [Reinekea sp.]